MFAILIIMVLANVLFLIIGYLAIPFFARIVSIKSSLLIPLVVMFAVAGSYVFRSDVFDILMLAFFGLFGVIARLGKFDVMPMVMGFILGEPLEYAFGQTLAMSEGNLIAFALSERPGMLAILVLTPIVGFLLWRSVNRKPALASESKTAEDSR